MNVLNTITHAPYVHVVEQLKQKHHKLSIQLKSSPAQSLREKITRELLALNETTAPVEDSLEIV